MRTFLAWLRGWRRRRRERWDRICEHLALQHQVRVLQRSGTRRPRLTPEDRLFWLILSRLWSRWRGSLSIVRPETVLKWRRQGLRLVFGRRHGGRWRGGQLRVDAEVREFIAHMARVNLLWGAPRIHGELLKVGFTVSEATVSRYLRSTGVQVPKSGARSADAPGLPATRGQKVRWLPYGTAGPSLRA